MARQKRKEAVDVLGGLKSQQTRQLLRQSTYTSGGGGGGYKQPN